MKKLLFFALLINAASTAHAQILSNLLGSNKKTLNVELDWQCSALDYNDSSAKSFPSNEKIQVEIVVKSNGKTTFKLTPNIFPRGITSFVKNNLKKFTVDVSDCAESFSQNFGKWTKTNKDEVCKLHKDYCNEQSKLAINFHKEFGAEAFKKENITETLLPKYFTGHQFIRYNNGELKQAVKNFCADGSGEKIQLLSFDFAVYLRELAINPLVNLPRNCFDQYDKLAKENELNVSCESTNELCSYIKDQANIFKRSLTNLGGARRSFIAYTRKKKANYTPFQVSNPKINKLVKEQVFAGLKYNETGTSIGCQIDPSFEDNTIVDNLFRYDEAIQKVLPEYLEKAPEFCVKLFLKSYIGYKFSETDPLDSAFCQKNACDHIKRQKAIFNENIKKILKTIVGPNVNLISCVDLTKTDNQRDEIQRFLDEIKEVSSCSELADGELKVVNGNITGVNAKYVLKRISEKELEATVAIDFKDNSSIPNAISGNEMFERAKKCLEKTSTYFSSPSGERLNVKIISKEENAQRQTGEKAPLNSVNVVGSGKRANSGNYPSDAQCGTITHEVLHLMGLVDEYKEKLDCIYVDTATGDILNTSVTQEEAARRVAEGSAKVELSYQCRVVPKSKSVMKNHSEAMNENAGSSTMCQCEDQTCRDIINHPNDKVRKLFFTSPFSTIEGLAKLCSSKRIKAKRVKSLAEVEKLPFMQIDKDEKDKIVFTTGEAQRRSIDTDITTLVDSYSCECAEENCEEIKKFKELFENQKFGSSGLCIRGSKMLGAEPLERLPNNESNIEIGEEDGEYILHKPTKKRNQSLLLPAQFARIKHGVCSSKVNNYTECAKYAYKDRFPKDCPDRPKICEDDEQWLNSEK